MTIIESPTDERLAPQPASQPAPQEEPQGPRARVAVIVLTQSDRPELTRALASVRAQEGLHVHLLLVVNGAEAPAQDLADEVIVLPENVGIPAGRNLGAAACDADVLVFLDDDAELQGSDHLATIIERFDADPGLGAMAVRIVDEHGETQRRHVPRVGAGSAARSGPVTHFVGATCAVRAEAFAAVGGFDPRFFYAMEESDLAWRLLDQRWAIWYSADLTTFHPHTLPSRHPNHVRLQARNRLWMAWRSLPVPLLLGYLLTWTLVPAARREPVREVLTGFREAWADRPERAPMRWRTVATMTRLGRPPVL